MRLALLLLALTSCGRLSFDVLGGDASGDGVGDQPFVCVAGNDEDSDGIPDCEDPCPHIALVQSDDDGDGVGNDCDPNPSTPGDVIVMFDPFVTLQPFWANEGASVANGQLVLLGEQGRRFAYLSTGMSRGRDSFEVSAVVDSGSDPFPQHVLIAHLRGTTQFYCEVLDGLGTSVAALQLAWTPDAVDYFAAASEQFDGASIIGGAGTLRMQILEDVVKCSAEWRGTERDTFASEPLAFVTDRVQLSAQNVTARLDWYLHIRSP